MSEESDVLEVEPTADAAAETSEGVVPPEPREPMPPVESRFMFVDIAALRAKQLRRGALPRVTLPPHEGEGEGAEPSRKLERIAMREVDEGLIVYDFPDMNKTEAASEDKETS